MTNAIKALGVGILISLTGCAAKTQTTVPWQTTAGGVGVVLSTPDKTPDKTLELIQQEIRKYHMWLSNSHKLLTPSWPPYNPDGRFDKQQFNTKTRKSSPLPPPPRPSAEEIKKKLNEMLMDPKYKQRLEQSKKAPKQIVRVMPAGSPSSVPTPPVSNRDSTWPGVRAACTGT